MQVRDIKPTISKLFCYHITYCDHMELWLGTNREVFDDATKAAIEARNGRVVVNERSMNPYDTEYRQKIELYQLTKESLKIVDDLLSKAACSYLIARLELAVDWITETQEDADKLRTIIETSYIHSVKNGFFFNRDTGSNTSDRDKLGTVYFADSKIQNLVPVLYNDRKKMVDAPTVHFEFRFLKTEGCKSNGFRVIRNVIDVDILEYMRRNVVFARLPSKEEIGSLVIKNEYDEEYPRSEQPTVSRRYKEIKCDKFFKSKNLVWGIPIQQLFSVLPELARRRDGKRKKDGKLEKFRNEPYHETMIGALFSQSRAKDIDSILDERKPRRIVGRKS